MSDIYELLHVSRGASYAEDKIWSKSFLKRFPTIPADKAPKGNSRVHGDVSTDCQKAVIDMIIGVGSRYGLNYKEIAYALLFCRAESGFNPDAAAGTTTASGLAQYTVDTVKDAKQRAKKYLKIELDMTDTLVFDATLGAHAVILSVLFCRDIAAQNGFVFSDPKYWQLLYMLHHDGPGRYTEKSGKDRIKEFDWSVDAIKTYNKIILEKLDPLSKMLQSKVETTLTLTGSDQAAVSGKDYVLAVVSTSNVSDVKAPTHASTALKDKPRPKLEIVKGKTDGQGMTRPITSGIGDEIIILLLPRNYRDLFMTSNAEHVHTVKKGETLSKIAKENDTTVAELKTANHISNANNINVGQTLELPPPKQLRHKPATWILDEIMKQLGFQGGNTDAFSYVWNHTARPKGSTSKSTDKSKPNTVELSTHIPAAEVTKKLKSKPEKHTTEKENPTKAVESLGEAFIYTYQSHRGYTRFYDNTGKILFDAASSSDIDSKSKANAAEPFKGKTKKYFTNVIGGSRSSRTGIAYGTTKIQSTDSRGRWIHGGGSRFKEKAYDENQGWAPTMGCTRMQNIDVEKLASVVQAFRKANPNVKIAILRDADKSF